MKSSDSTEMDRLLRRYARRKGETLRATHDSVSDVQTNPPGGSHLDADEMNAYAENALPEAARSRYFAHLADCETCRKLVTELALAASVSNEGKARVAALDIKPPTSWRAWLAALFSPPVLRYGVPAMALLAVLVVVAIVATRSRRDAGSVVQSRDESRYSAPANAPTSQSATANTTATGADRNHSNSNATSLAEQQLPAQPGVDATPLPEKDGPVTEAAPVVSQDTVTKSTSPPADDNKDKSGEFGIVGKREQSEVAAAPPPAAKLPVLSAPAATERQRRDMPDEPTPSKSAGKDDTDELPVNGRAAGGVGANKPQANEDRNTMDGTAGTTTRAAQNQARRKASAAPKSAPAANAVTERERKDTSPEIQNVGGRKFQKQGNAWVDTDYNSSRSTTNIQRGSERYRALVADEPGLRSITERLGGVVIVVWKSRAYRFY